MRSLERKYGVPVSTISHRAKREGWKETEAKVKSEIEQAMVKKVTDKYSEISDDLCEALMIATKKIRNGLRCVDKTDSAKIRSYTAALKDIRDIGMFKSDLDKAEQMARIKKLEKEASSEVADNTINVVISDEVSEYAN